MRAMLMPRIIRALCCVYAIVVAAVAAIALVGPERWWWAGFNMFLPQSIWALPAIIIFPLAFWRARRWAWLPFLSLLAVVGPIMGLCWGNAGTPPPGTALRVMTYNVQLWQRANVPAIIAEIRDAAPDILCLQDARGASRGQVAAFLSDWHVASAGQYVIASKFPIIDSAVGDISYRGEEHSYLRARIDVAGQPITVVSAHFITPRDALTGVRSESFVTDGVPIVQTNLSDRLTQARALAEDIRRSTGPLIVAGDLNAPPQALASRMLTDVGLIDAFARSGRGYGYTFGHTLIFGTSFLRIDRILATKEFFFVRAAVGSAEGADHRPVIADMVLRKGHPGE